MNAVISTVLAWLRGVFMGIWDAFVTLFNTCLKWVLDLLNDLLSFLVTQFFLALKAGLSILPMAPEWQSVGPVPALLAQANYFVPLDVLSGCLALIGATYALTYLYKGGKFLRGGG